MKKLLLVLICVLALSGCNAPVQPPVDETPPVQEYIQEEQPQEPPEQVLEEEPQELPEEEQIPEPVYGNGYDPNRAPYLFDVQPIKAPKSVKKRDGLYVLKPARVEEFINLDLPWEYDDNLPFDPSGEHFGFIEDFHPGCSWKCGVCALELSEASSTLKNSGELSYHSENVLYANRNASWVENSAGYGIGESVTIRKIYAPSSYIYNDLEEQFPNEDDMFYDYDRQLPEDFLEWTFQIDEMCIVNGYAKSADLWKKNSRVKTLKMYVNEKPYAYVELKDTIKPQYFPLYEISPHFGETTSLRFEIVDVYKGKVKDTCITSIIFHEIGINGAH